MPFLGALIQKLGERLVAWLTQLFGVTWTIRLSAGAALAAGYVTCVVGFSALIAPWFDAITSTTYGQVLGLAFPPVSGTVVAGLVTLWTCVFTLRYTKQLMDVMRTA